MDLHDYQDVAENYDKYIDSLVGFAGFDNQTCIDFHIQLAGVYGEAGVMDIGCGTGLIMKPLLEAGHRVIGLDLSGEMLEQCRAKLEARGIGEDRYKLMNANMTSFDIDGEVSLVLIPRSGFLHLLDTESQIAALESINKSLRLGGHLSLNTFYPFYDRISEMGNGREEKPFYRTSFVNDRGNKVAIYNSMVYYHDSQIMKGEWQFKELDQEGQVKSVKKRPVTMRWSFKSEMELLFKLCGFKVQQVYGGYDKSEAAYPGQLVWVVQKVNEI